jgi:glycosyl transferase family 2
MKHPEIKNVNIIDRPFWSVMIPIKNRSIFLPDAINSVLANKIPADKMQIEVVDFSTVDCGAEKIVKDLGQGRITYVKDTESTGMAANWNSCIEQATGQYVHILHEDDFVAPTFYAELYDSINQNPDYGFYCCNSMLVDEKGVSKNISIGPRELLKKSPNLKVIATGCIYTPSVVVKRECYETLGGFNADLVFALDMEMWVRVINKYRGMFLDKDLAFYRYSDKNETFRLFADGTNIFDEKKFLLTLREYRIDISDAYIRDMVIKRSYQQYLLFTEKGDFDAAKSNYKIFADNTNIFFRTHYKCVNSWFYQLKVKYYIPRFFYYVFHPWQITKYINRLMNVENQ